LSSVTAKSDRPQKAMVCPTWENAGVDRTPELKFIGEPGEELAVWEWPGEDPPFLFAHATGFHGRCWDHIIRMFPRRHCLALDARGRDLTAVAEQWAVREAIGIGHSSGGHTTVQVAALRPQTYRALLLLDPTIFPLEFYGTAPPDASFTLRRRAVWASPGEMFERFKTRLPFARWRPEILQDYCDFGLLPRDGKFVLACPPAVELSIYLNSREPASNIYAEVARVPHPVVVMRAGRERQHETFDLAASPTAVDLASRFAQGRDVLLPEATHFIPMEAPETVAEEIGRLAAG
jgi:pimeloyl-ACP methyl ester carboxylesterase